MIDVVTWENRDEFIPELIAMHQLRKKVFADRMGWEVTVEGDQEIDEFDRLPGTVYLLYRGDDGVVRGCARLLPTTGPNMLRDVFPVLLDGGPMPRAPRIWESTRFAVDDAGEINAGIGRGTTELLVGMTEVALAYGVTRVISVCDIRVERVLKRAGLPVARIGSSHRIGCTIAVAGYYDPSPVLLDSLATATGISGSVIAASPWTDTRKVA